MNFHERLWDLLPDIYRTMDTEGDLDVLLQIVAPELDELESLIVRLPEIWDIHNCPPRYLPLLGQLIHPHVVNSRFIALLSRHFREPP